MANKLNNLPTKPTQVNPDSGIPFIRVRQHYNPNKDQPKQKNNQQVDRVNKEGVGLDDRSNSNRSKIKAKKFAKRLEEVHNGIPQETVNTGSIKPSSGFLSTAERGFDLVIPSSILEKELISQSKKTSNGVYRINVGLENEGFYKPDAKADVNIMQYITGNFSGREAMAYEMTKVFGIEGLVPPTRVQSPKIMDKGIEFGHNIDTKGSLMMSANEFGERHLEVSSVSQAFIVAKGEKGMSDLYENTKNIADLVVFDFIIGNVDRHGMNFFVGKDIDGYSAIGIDHGFSFPEHGADKMGNAYDQHNTIGTQKEIMKTGAASQPIDSKFQAAIMEFDGDKFSNLCKEHGISDIARDGVMNRLQSIKEETVSKYRDLQNEQQPEDFSSMEEYKRFMIKKLKITPYDIAQIAKKKYNTVLI